MHDPIHESDKQEAAMSMIHRAVGYAVELKNPRPRDERGLSQSTENAILLAGAAAVALIIISVITAYVTERLDRIPG